MSSHAEEEFRRRGFGDTGSTRRRRVLGETLEAFERADPIDRYHRLAMDNLSRWRAQRREAPGLLRVAVLSGDWGEVARVLTRACGECFAVLNMANPHVPGGGYIEGAMAQEENMFRRTDCHFRIDPDQREAASGNYVRSMTRLLTARDGGVYLDTERPRVCIRGPEDRSAPDLGYPWLPEDQVFPFFELRAAAQDLRDGSPFDEADARRRIAAQLDTLRSRGVRHAVLSAFGCGAFRNPADRVAHLYREELMTRERDLVLVAFAIFAPGYGPDNYTPFARVFGGG